MEEKREIVTLKCSGCQRTFKSYKPQAPGRYPVTCPHCKHKNILEIKSLETTVKYNLGKKQMRPQNNDELKETLVSSISVKKPTIGKLVWRGFIFLKQCTLHDGINTVGRKNKERMPDVAIKDEYISRQSAIIDVQTTIEKGTTYEFIVKKTKNPILVNGRMLRVGEAVFLNFGDTIKMGNTVLVFKEVR